MGFWRSVPASRKRQCLASLSRASWFLVFAQFCAGGKVDTLNRWMEDARKTGIHSLVRFVRTLKQDLSAVESAVREPWSTGPVEGQLNRLKMVKRRMYGRAGIELLRACYPSLRLVAHNIAPKLRQNP
jgi:transposase